MTSADVAILGCGAIGSLIAARLSANCRPVVAPARGPHLAVMQLQELQLTDEDGTHSFHRFSVTDRLDVLPEAGTLLVTRKAYQIAPFAPALAERAASFAARVFAENGIRRWYTRGFVWVEGLPFEATDPGNALSRVLWYGSVLGGILYMIVALRWQGWAHEIPMQGERLLIGADTDDRARVESVVQLLDVPGNPAAAVADFRRAGWEKLLGKVAVNAVCMVACVSLDRVMAGLNPPPPI